MQSRGETSSHCVHSPFCFVFLTDRQFKTIEQKSTKPRWFSEATASSGVEQWVHKISTTKTGIDLIVSLPVVGIEFAPIREEAGPAVVEQGGQSHARVPVRGEVVDARFGQHGLNCARNREPETPINGRQHVLHQNTNGSISVGKHSFRFSIEFQLRVSHSNSCLMVLVVDVIRKRWNDFCSSIKFCREISFNCYRKMAGGSEKQLLAETRHLANYANQFNFCKSHVP